MVRIFNFFLPYRFFAVALMDVVVMVAMLLSVQQSTPLLGAPGHFWSFVILGLTLVVSLTSFYLFDLYDFHIARSPRQVFSAILRATGAILLFLLPLSLLLPDTLHERVVELHLVALVVTVCLYRSMAEWLHRQILPRESTLLVGSGPRIQLLATAIKQQTGLAIRLRGVLLDAEEVMPSKELQFEVCGRLQDLRTVARLHRIKRIAICSDAANRLSFAELIALRRDGVGIDDADELYEGLTGRLPVERITEHYLAYGKSLRPSSLGLLLQRLVGSLIAAAAIVMLAPILAAIALAIKLDSRGPVLYRQERVGLHGKTFWVLKFRSMRADAETASGPVWAQQKDSRITAVGRVLRILRLDELPQLWNVLRGEMAIVGPRPERPHFVEILAEKIPFYDLRHTTRPGITGWAQVCAGYGATVDESREKLEYDLFYLRHSSPVLDALIFLRTVKIMLCGKGAR
jgi:exopolysaccharide biosynthesis polyprenyl glycosylphosphotransferase